MTAVSPASVFAPTGGVTWSRVDAGFYVGSRAGEYVGSIDVTADGSHVAFDGRSTPLGRYPSLREAQRAVARQRRTLAPEPTRSTRLVWSAATLAGAVAGGLLVGVGVQTML